MNRPAQAFQRIRSFVSSQADLSRSLARALQDRPINPYSYLKPFIEKAAGVREPPVNPTPHAVVYTRGSMRLLRFEPAVRRHRDADPVRLLAHQPLLHPRLPARPQPDRVHARPGLRRLRHRLGHAGPDEEHLTWERAARRHDATRRALDALRTSGASDAHACTAIAWAARWRSPTRPCTPRAAQLRRPGDPGRLQRGRHLLHVDAARALQRRRAGRRLRQRPDRRDGERLLDGGPRPAPHQVAGGVSPHRRPRVRHHLPRAWSAGAPTPCRSPASCIASTSRTATSRTSFAGNRMEVGGERVDLGRIRAPLLNIIAEHDTIAPAGHERAARRAWWAPRTRRPCASRWATSACRPRASGR